MIAKCETCGSPTLAVDRGRGQRFCRSCYLAHLKKVAAIYGSAGFEEQRQAILVELRKAEETIL